MAELGIRTEGRLILTGGGASSEAYRQVLADLSERPVFVSDIKESSAAGAAVQAAAVFHGETVRTIAQDWAPTLRLVTEPNPRVDRDDVLQHHRQAAAWDDLDFQYHNLTEEG
jgi:xylulokinase